MAHRPAGRGHVPIHPQEHEPYPKGGRPFQLSRALNDIIIRLQTHDVGSGSCMTIACLVFCGQPNGVAGEATLRASEDALRPQHLVHLHGTQQQSINLFALTLLATTFLRQVGTCGRCAPQEQGMSAPGGLARVRRTNQVAEVQSRSITTIASTVSSGDAR